jgi:hypothetical protein
LNADRHFYCCTIGRFDQLFLRANAPLTFAGRRSVSTKRSCCCRWNCGDLLTEFTVRLPRSSAGVLNRLCRVLHHPHVRPASSFICIDLVLQTCGRFSLVDISGTRVGGILRPLQLF